MVQNGRRRDPFTAAMEGGRRRKRGENRRAVRSVAGCFSPWSFISGWFHWRRSKDGMNSDELCGDDDIENRIAVRCLDPESSNSALEVSVSGDHNKEASFSLGVGLGLIYLMAKNNNEISKLAELCRQMETMLQNLKREFGNDQGNINTSDSTPKAKIFSSYPMIDHVSVQDCPSYSWERENSESDFTSSSYQNSHSRANRKGKESEMDQLQAELEAELEHLQLHLDNEVTLNCSDQRNSEIVAEEFAPEETRSTSFKEASERQEMENIKQQGVNPRELERRLHELQEASEAAGKDQRA